jgi:hypothetical protein
MTLKNAKQHHPRLVTNRSKTIGRWTVPLDNLTTAQEKP